MQTNVIMFLSLSMAAHLISGSKYSIFPTPAGTQLQVIEGEGFTMTVVPKDESLITCTVKHPLGTLNFTQSTNASSNNISYWGNGLEEGDCGVKISDFRKTLAGPWRFTISVKSEDNPITIMVSLKSIDPPRQPSPANYTTSLGELVDINCSNSDTLRCTFLAPDGRVFTPGSSCKVQISSVTIKDVGVWTCFAALKGRMEEVETNFTIIANPIKTIDIGSNLNTASYDLFCNSLTNTIVNYCQFERPDGKRFYLKDGSSAGRYTYIGQGTSSRMCGISITTPLEPYDKGVWTCKLISQNGDETGGFISLEESQTSGYTSGLVSPSGLSEITIQNGTELIIKCSIKEIVKYCWLRHPNGTRYSPHPDEQTSEYTYVGRGLEFGDCGMKINGANLSDSGIWTCGMGVNLDKGVSEDVQTSITVLISESRLIENRSLTVASVGDWAILGCRSLKGEGLEYCSFVAPNGTGYSLTNAAKSTKNLRFSYQGNGLENGHCGLLINPVRSEDYGVWKCAAMLIDAKDSQEYYRNIILSQSANFDQAGISTSSAIGIAIGVIVVILVGIFIMWRRQFRRAPPLKIITEPRPTVLSVTSNITDSSDEMGNIHINEDPQRVEVHFSNS